MTETGYNISNRDIHTNCPGNIYLTMWHNISTKTQKPHVLIQERMLQAYKRTKQNIWSLKDKNIK